MSQFSKRRIFDMNNYSKRISRRDFMKAAGIGSAAALAAASGLPGRAAFAATPQQTSDVTATLTIFDFGADTQLKVYADAIARFNKRFPNVTVKDENIPFPNGWGEYINILKTRFASGTAPDIVAMAIEGARESVQSGLMTTLDDYLSKDAAGKDLLSDVDKALNDALKFKDKTYWLTREWNNMCIHYNTKMFEDAKLDPPANDWTWDKFLETALKLTKGSGGDKVYGFGIPYFNFGLAPWWHTNQTSTLTPDWSDSNLNDPKMLESVKFVHDLVAKHGVSPAVEGTDQFALFASGRAAMTGAGHWPLHQWTDAKLPMDVQYWPRHTAATTVFGSGGWGITTACKNPDVAWELIKELTSRETDKAVAAIGVALPARRSATEVAEFKAFPKHSDVFFGSLADIKPIPSPANFAQVESIFMRHLGEIMSDAVTPEQGLEAAHTELSAAMAELKGK
jgi:multiple sugar transport system substrate-binding protein